MRKPYVSLAEQKSLRLTKITSLRATMLQVSWQDLDTRETSPMYCLVLPTTKFVRQMFPRGPLVLEACTLRDDYLLVTLRLDLTRSDCLAKDSPRLSTNGPSNGPPRPNMS